MTSSGWGAGEGEGGGEVKNGKNSEGSGWFHGGEGKGIHRNWMSAAIISMFY